LIRDIACKVSGPFGGTENAASSTLCSVSVRAGEAGIQGQLYDFATEDFFQITAYGVIILIAKGIRQEIHLRFPEN